MSDLILAATPWPTNAAMIADVARLGYLDRDVLTLDATYGLGKWWDDWRPDQLIASDKYKGPMRADFRRLPFRDGTFGQIAYDPPYVCPGGLKTSNVKEMHGRYGMDSGGGEVEVERDFSTPAELQQIMDDGLTEMLRVARPKQRGYPGAIVMMKCKSYVWSGKLWLGAHHSRTHAVTLGFTIVDELTHLGSPGAQSQKCQVHARNNFSTLLILRAPRRIDPQLAA